jgi:hypothetical protein
MTNNSFQIAEGREKTANPAIESLLIYENTLRTAV